MIDVKISRIGAYTSSNTISSQEIEARVNEKKQWLAEGTLERLFGVKHRRFADKNIQASDMAVSAAKIVLQAIDPTTIDCLIFSAASSDLIEPATANIVQAKLGLTCAVFDVKNACNSFVTGIQIASSFIKSEQYKKVLVVNGEILHQAIKYTINDQEELIRRLASFSLGDAGAAALIEQSLDESKIVYHDTISLGHYWQLCTIPGGGSMFPHDGDKNYFEGRTSELKDVFLREKGLIFDTCFKKSGWKKEEIDHIFMHQVSKNTFEAVAKDLELPLEKFYSIIEQYGNTASASIPLSMYLAEKEGKLKKGQKVMVIGLASGISISVQLIVW